MAAFSNSSGASYRFGEVEVFPVERQLTVAGRQVGVGARAFDVLLALIEHRDRLVARNELLDLVWGDAAVEPNNLDVQIGVLRKLLGPQTIATIPGRGYRFSARVEESMPLVRPVATVVPVTLNRTNLPEQLPPLIGRDDDLRTVGDLIADHRIVTVVGAGGIGKSCFAQQLLHERRDKYRHGVCWIELAAINDASSLPSAIAAGLGIHLASGEPAALLAVALAPLELLIGLDNAEHLATDAGRLVEALVAASREVRILITSQVPLHVKDEQVVRLGALSVAPADARAEEALAYGAVDLFVQRACAVDPNFSFNDGNASTVVRLCQRLDGLPLAIEFAAARAPLLGIERVIASLDQRLSVLRGGHRSSPARQQTMRAALEWSHQLLSDHERVVFRRLAIVADSASLELIQTIVADTDHAGPDANPPLDRWAVTDALGGLIERSLVAIVSDDRDPDRPRYRLLETPRAYAAERLAAAGEVALLEERHARAVARLLDDAWVDRWSGRVGFRDWVDQVEADRENARVAFAWALREQAFDLVMAMAPVLLIRSLPRSTRDERAAIADAVDRWLKTQPLEPAQLRTRMQLMRFWAERELARSLIEAPLALSLAEASDDRFAAYMIEALRVRFHAQRRDLDAATAARARVDVLEDPSWPAIRLYLGAEARSFYWLVQGPPAMALEFARQAFRLVRLSGDPATVSASNLIDAELLAGDASAAADRGLKLLEELGDSRDEFGLINVRVNVSAALLAMNDVARAKPVARAAWQTAHYFAVHGDCSDYLALICAIEKRWTAAATLVGYADAVYACRGAQRWPNEAQAHDRTVRLARDALGNSEFERLVSEGERISNIEVAAIAFALE